MIAKHVDPKIKKQMTLRNYQYFKNQFDELKKPCVLFVGPPGCGKGTQSEILKNKTGWTHISTGDILRESKNEEIKKIMKTGNLLPDNLVAIELEKFLNKNKKAKGFIFDGYPRNLQQKELFEEILKSNGIKIICIFFLDVLEEELGERIKERGKTSGRSDDKDPEVFKIRIKEYNTQTLPMINSMMKERNFIKIPGNLFLEDITKEVEKRIISRIEI